MHAETTRFTAQFIMHIHDYTYRWPSKDWLLKHYNVSYTNVINLDPFRYSQSCCNI